MNFFNIKNAGLISGLLGAMLATSAWAQPCPDKNVNYWQAFNPVANLIYQRVTNKLCSNANAPRLKPSCNTRRVRVAH